MNKQDTSVGLLVGKNDPTTRSICQALANEGITVIVKQKEGGVAKQEETESETPVSHWSGQPGKDLFFNGWKLLF